MTSSLISSKASPLKGIASVPGDKSISHRALMLGGLAVGETIISNLLEGEDVIATAFAMRAMGANITRGDDGLWRCFGTGIGFLKAPTKDLEMGNSGTSTRLLAGLIAGHGLRARMVGDASLSKRPMNRIITPLSEMGAKFDTADGGRLPMVIQGASQVQGITYRLPIASAQVKSAILLAGLTSDEPVRVIEDKPTRDHTENMLRGFGYPVEVEAHEEGGTLISIQGGQQMKGMAIDVPCDPSSAAFPCVAALLVEESEVTLPRIGMNKTRSGLYLTLKDMGADIVFRNERLEGGEPVADLVVKHNGALKGIDVPAARVPSMIDEFPILAVAASCAQGVTRMSGLEELRVKESDRLAVMAQGLAKCGVKLEEGRDTLMIHGNGKPPQGGVRIKTHLDHRIAMSFLVLGMVSEEPIEIDDSSPIRTSFPTFIDLMSDLGVDFRGCED